MKATDTFKNTINDHLQGLAIKDPLFAEALKKPNKNIDDCINYIFNAVQDSKCNGFADEEIFGMAIHYYDEDDLKPGKPVNGRVVVNHAVELTAEEIQQAKDKALENIRIEQRAKLTARASKKKEESPEAQSSLF